MHLQQQEHTFAMEADDDVAVVDRFGAKMITLNSLGGVLWSHVEEPATPEQLVSVLAEQWPDVDPEQLRSDVDAFVASAIEAGIIVVVDPS